MALIDNVSTLVRPKGAAGVLGSVGATLGTRRAGAALGGAAVVGTMLGSNQIFGDDGKRLFGPDQAPTYGLQQGIFEGVLGTPYPDVAITGKQLNMWDAWIKPNLLPDRFVPDSIRRANTRWNAAAHYNSQSIPNWQADRRADRFRFNHDADWDGDVFTFQNAGDTLRGDVAGVTGLFDPGGQSSRPSYDYHPISSGMTYTPRAFNQAQDPDFGRINFGMYNRRHGQ